MNYELRFSLSYDENHWNKHTFQEDVLDFYESLLRKKFFSGSEVEDWYIKFQHGTPKIAADIRKWCEDEGYNYDLWVFQRYSQKDARNALYVPFKSGSRYDRTDVDEDYVPYNFYKERPCDTCGIGDLNIIPSPYKISKRILEDKRDVSSESNGVTVLSEWAFDTLRDEIEPWIVCGDVEIADSGKYEDVKQKYVWIRPTNTVGPYVDSKVLRKCEKCGRPTEIRQRRSENIFDMDKQTVESFRGLKAPIVLAGNWFGEIIPGGIASLHQDVFISGELYKKVKKLKLKGFYKTDYVIHAADEPYDWDPMKDWSNV